MKSYKKYIFDLDYTLLIPDWSKEDDFLRKSIPLKEQKDFFKQKQEILNKYELEFPRYDFETLSGFFRSYGFHVSEDVIEGWMIHNGETIIDKVPDGVIDLLQYLKANGKSIVLLTSWFSGTQIPRLKRTGLYEYIDKIVAGEDAMKPDLESFELAIGDTDKKDCIMIGDSIKSDKAGAENAGIDCFIVDKEHSIRDLYEIITNGKSKQTNNTGLVYHGSKVHGLKRLEPRKSTHGSYVYATPYKVLALHFSGRCGDDLTYDIGHFDTNEDGPWELVENIPGALEKMYSNSSSIYSLSDAKFKDINSGFAEVVSEEPVDVVKEDYCESVYDAILEAEKEGLIKIYRYPNKPKSFKPDGSDLLDKFKSYKELFGVELDQSKWERLVYLHPELLDKINALAKSMGYSYHYRPEDLIIIFKSRIKRQLSNLDNDQYIECVYTSLSTSFPELKPELDQLLSSYYEELGKLSKKETVQLEETK